MQLLTITWFIVTVMFAGASIVPATATERPTKPNGGATEVQVEAVLLDVDEISGANQNFVANFYVAARWQDARLAHQRPESLVRPLNEVWHPNLQFVNQQRIFLSFPEVAMIAPDGEVSYRQRVWGPFSQPMDLREFPFDRQIFEIRMVASGYTPEEVRFVPDPKQSSGLAPRFSQPDWNVLQWRLDTTPYEAFVGGASDASFAFVFDAERKKGYFVWKIIFPLILIVAMSWVVFWIDPVEAGTQIGVAMTSMLTLIAYRFMVGNLVPNVSYLTRMDYFILGSTLLVFAALIQAIMTTRLVRNKKTLTAQRLDRGCRVIFPVSFSGLAVWSLFF